MSRGLVGRLEKGEPGVAMGTAFQAAGLLGIRHFEADQPNLEMLLATTRKILTLLPRASRPRKVFDDF